MNILLNRKNFYLLILFYSLLAICFALYIEHILDYKPCKLCLYQRIPYIIAIFISFIGYNYLKNEQILMLIIINFLLSVLVSGYHYGIENNIFKEFSGCTSSSLKIVDKAEIINSLNENVASCKDAIFKLFGMSLAGINFMLSLLIIVYSLITLFYEKN